ncbi:DNA ligase [Dirofilaria immitis]
MPSNIQYNTPMPIYSREAAEEQYKQQVGAGPDHALGARDRHFNPEISETLKAIQAGENDTFGQHFNELIAQAEIPHIPPPQEPYWAHAARSRSERARSATPSAAQPYYAPHYSTLQHSKNRSEERSNVAAKRGYEFGGLDYVDRSRIPQDSSYAYYADNRRYHDEQKATTPGYEMGGMDFRKGAIGMDGPYHGHGPEQRRLHPKFDHTSLKRDEMNIEVAPNVDRVSADILVGDTRSNQHITRNEQPDHSFGTSFGPTVGFTREHRTVNRQEETSRPTTFSLSAKKDNSVYRRNDTYKGRNTYSMTPQPYHGTTVQPSTDLAGYTSQTVTNYASTGTTGKRTDTGAVSMPYTKTEQPWIRSQTTTTPVGRSEWSNENVEKETYDYQPTWSRIVSDRRNIWEDKARNTDARIQMPPSSKIPPQQPPYWYNRANQTHALWQNEADRQNRDGYGSGIQTNYNYTEYHENQRKHEKYDIQKRHEEYSSDVRPIDDYDGFVSKTQYTTHTGRNDSGPENLQQSYPPYHTSSSYSSNQQQQYTSEHGVPITQSTNLSYTPVPIRSSYPISSSTQQEPSTWQSQSSRYEQKIHESSTERMTCNQPAVPLSASNSTDTYAIQKTNYQRKTHHETAAPYSASIVSVTQGSGAFDRHAEMSEILPRGTVANTEASLQGNYVDKDGQPVSYKREVVTSVNPNSESTLLKEEEKRVVETPLEPGVISRHVTTKYYKKKTVTDTTTTSTTLQ